MHQTDPSNPGQPATELTTPTPIDQPYAPIHDCWNRIGVEGNATCRELSKYIHCRNCPVYSAAGMQLLNRPLPAEYRRERAAHYAQRKTITQPARLSVVIFRIAAEWFALPTTVFQEIAEQRAIHTLPHRRGGLALGLVNVRGELLICASAARLLGLEETLFKREDRERQMEVGNRPSTTHHTPSTQYTRLLVADWQSQRVAIPVGEVQGIQRFQTDDLQETPTTIARSARTYTEGVFAWRDRSVGLLEVQTFFTTLNRSLT